MDCQMQANLVASAMPPTLVKKARNRNGLKYARSYRRMHLGLARPFLGPAQKGSFREKSLPSVAVSVVAVS